MSIIVNPLALGWKHNNTPGIECRANAQGQIELTAWPVSLGSMPTQGEVDQWASEYATAMSAPPKIITYGSFAARFTQTELDDATKHIYAVNTTTGLPTQPRLQQAVTRAAANDKVDLQSPTTIAVMDALVAAGVITAQRKTEILTP